MNAHRTIGCFVTGTDTGVGKTLASCGLLHALARHHARVVGMKAVAAGAEPDGQGGWANEDTLALRAASTLAVPPELDNPVLLPDPMSPHIAAQRAGRSIEIAHIVDSYRRLAEQADAVVVEGAGGWFTPLSQEQTFADWVMAERLPVTASLALARTLPGNRSSLACKCQGHCGAIGLAGAPSGLVDGLLSLALPALPALPA